jgi:hypothetical protein
VRKDILIWEWEEYISTIESKINGVD